MESHPMSKYGEKCISNEYKYILKDKKQNLQNDEKKNILDLLKNDPIKKYIIENWF